REAGRSIENRLIFPPYRRCLSPFGDRGALGGRCDLLKCRASLHARRIPGGEKRKRVSSDTNSPLVRITDLNFAYDSRPILTGINLEIPRGKLVAIMGTSGCGKTTLLRAIGGQLRASAGEVVVDGQNV